jgi:methylenetetrahydrofolate dehydrogenase (NADP+)/methenyltetrahydrofolate cyclohydrolase
MSGKHAVIVGRSNIVGKPMASLLLLEDATVTICHSRTHDLPNVCKTADILICAIGKANMFDHNYIKPNAIVIDVGMNRDENGHICGDVNFNDVKNLPGSITPVPGGVGPMTITMLMYNLLTLTKLQKEIK